MEEANLTNANLEGAKLRFTHFEGANLLNSKGLTQEHLRIIFFDNETRFPDYLRGFLDKETIFVHMGKTK